MIKRALYGGLVLATALLTAAGLGMCDPSFEDVIEDHTAELEPLLATLVAITRHATTTPALTAPHPARPNPPLRRHSTYGSDREDNVETLLLDDLASLPDLGRSPGWSRPASLLHRCAAHLRRGREPSVPESTLDRPVRLCPLRAEVLLDACEHLEYIAVVRIHELVQPGPAALLDSKDGTFRAGSVRGDVLVYSLTTGELLAGAPYFVENNEAVDESSDMATRLLDDLGARLNHQVNQVLRDTAGQETRF